jgi:hypothetical protein
MRLGSLSGTFFQTILALIVAKLIRASWNLTMSGDERKRRSAKWLDKAIQ